MLLVQCGFGLIAANWRGTPGGHGGHLAGTARRRRWPAGARRGDRCP